MSMTDGAPKYDYIAYIDESGDPGIEQVRPRDSGGSEWLVMGAALTEASDELSPVQWTRSILDSIPTKRPAIHFADLRQWQKPIVCDGLAKLPVALFAVLSNKKNMRQHRNERAAAKSNPFTPRQTFYNFCTRLLLERVTHCVLRCSLRKYGEPRHVKIVFARRLGHSYGHMFAYQEMLKRQSRAGTTFLGKHVIRWEVMDYRLLEVGDPLVHAGLQLADVVASAFYTAVDILPPTVRNPQNAQLLRPRMATYERRFENYGVMFVPFDYWEAKLTPEQIDIFEFYGFQRFDFHEPPSWLRKKKG